MRKFFKTRAVGFYLLIAAALLALAADFVYFHFYHSDAQLVRYYTASAFAVPFIAVAASAVLALFRVTERWAGLVFFGLELCAFMLFVNGTYMYLSSAFYSGFNMDAVLALSPGFLATAVLYVVILIAGAVLTFMRMRKKERKGEN